ncbi:MAG: response regulator [Acidobacteria bacterium]|nr:response regulator [Acidobacteriota bacterium]
MRPRTLLGSRTPAFHAGVSIVLLILAATLDSVRPFGRSYSIFYLFPVFYTAWALRGRLEMGIHLLILFTAYLRNLASGERVFTFNRVTGTLVAFAFIGFMWERRRYIAALQQVNAELEDRVQARTQSLTELSERFRHAADVKTQFLRNMSHEIRTPLNAIIGVTSLLRDAKGEEERSELIDTLDQSSRLTLGIVNDILDLSQIEAGRMEMDQAPFSLQSTVRDVLGMVEAEARMKGLTLSDNTPECRLGMVMGDARRLRQILMNLVGNAVKFTSSGFVHLQLQVLEQAGGRCKVKISVEDSGIGIPGDAHLFEKFTQADASIGRKFGGSGLGLAITKGLVDLMGGQIEVESEVGKGSTFWVMLEFALAEVEPRAEVKQSVEMTQAVRVLVAEDNVVNQRLVRRFLDRLGCTARIVTDGQEALEALRAESFDVVFMDCHMPVMDGYEATRVLRGMEGPRIPVVAMTASVLMEDREACFAAGMDDFLAKPFSLEDFRGMVERWGRVTRACGSQSIR